jgi:hypothetical protein
MAKGYPDFFGIPQWPQLGGATEETVEDTVPFGDALSVDLIEDKGQLYFLRVTLTDNDDVFNCTVVVSVDGAPLSEYAETKGTVKRNLANVAYSLYASRIDYTNNVLELTFVGPVPFGEKVHLDITNDGTQDVTAYILGTYASVFGGVIPT